jgi:hypothetical protein
VVSCRGRKWLAEGLSGPSLPQHTPYKQVVTKKAGKTDWCGSSLHVHYRLITAASFAAAFPSPNRLNLPSTSTISHLSAPASTLVPAD